MAGVILLELPLLACCLAVAAAMAGALVLALRRTTTKPVDRWAVRRSLVGVRGVVTAVIPLGGFGEIRARVAERSLRLRARSDRPLELGAPVVVVEQLDESTVLVRELPGLTR